MLGTRCYSLLWLLVRLGSGLPPVVYAAGICNTASSLLLTSAPLPPVAWGLRQMVQRPASTVHHFHQLHGACARWFRGLHAWHALSVMCGLLACLLACACLLVLAGHVKIEVTFHIDEHGVLNVSATDLDTHKQEQWLREGYMVARVTPPAV